MKKSIYIALGLLGLCCLNACNDDDIRIGNPVMDISPIDADAYFGDSLPFTIKATDIEVPLSTLKAQLFYGDEKVSETVIRTQTSRDDYTGKIYVPFWANIADGKATLKYILQNINFTTSEKEVEVNIKRFDYPFLTLVTSEGVEHKMERNEIYQYSVTSNFAQELNGYIKTPKAGVNGNEITFGWESGSINQGVTSPISFSSTSVGNYTITFNTYSYEASPFSKITVNGESLEAVDNENFRIDMNLKSGQLLAFDGIPAFDEWWIDTDYFTIRSDGQLEFLPISGSYRILANMKLKCFFVQTLSNGELATLQNDGTGAVWIIGSDIGKPSLAAKEVGWTTENGLCMSQLSPKKHQVTLVAGRQVNAENINFKFFHQQGWGSEFNGTTLTSTHEIVGVGIGEDGHDNGNLYIKDGQSLQNGHIYKFVVDVTAGIDQAVLTVEDLGEQPVEALNITFCGVKMETVDGDIYTASLKLNQSQSIQFTGIDNVGNWWINPDYFLVNEAGISFIPVDGSYRIVANTVTKTLTASRLIDGADATLNEDGSGAIWMMGWGVGSPSLDQQLGWNPGAAYCLPEIRPNVYQFICTAGPEQGSSIGQRIRFDYLSCKFFHQNGWGGEFGGDAALAIAPGSEAYITNNGNIELASGVQLEEGTTYVMTVDLTDGINNGKILFGKR